MVFGGDPKGPITGKKYTNHSPFVYYETLVACLYNVYRSHRLAAKRMPVYNYNYYNNR